jgi:hypothetical protein
MALCMAELVTRKKKNQIKRTEQYKSHKQRIVIVSGACKARKRPWIPSRLRISMYQHRRKRFKPIKNQLNREFPFSYYSISDFKSRASLFEKKNVA